MTIEEKAKEFAGLNSDSKDVLACLLRSLTYKGYMAGAEWMLAKATAWIVKQGSKTNDGVIMICVEDFVKAMKDE